MQLTFTSPLPARQLFYVQSPSPLCTRHRVSMQSKPSRSSQPKESLDGILKKKGYRDHDNVILFDGVCNMCNTGVDVVLRHDATKQFKFAPLQSETGRALTAKYSCPSDLSTMVYIEAGKPYITSDAMLRIGRRLHWTFALPSKFVLLTVPKPLRDFVYTHIIAKNRYYVFGKRDQCRICQSNNDNTFFD